MAYCLYSPYCSVAFFVIEGTNSQSARVSWGVAVWKVQCSILCLRLVLLQVLGKTRKVTETNESTQSVIQLVWIPLQMETLSTCTSVAVKTCKMKQKKAVPCLHPCLMDVPLLLWAVVYCQGRTLGREPAQQEASLAMNRRKTALQKEQCPVWATSFTTTST